MSHALPLVDAAAPVLLALLVAGFLVAFLRLVKGPTLPDRVVAIDLMTMLAVGIIAVYAIITDESAFLDAAIILALVAFLATVGFARYVETRGSEDTREEVERS